MKEEFKNINNKDKNQNVYTSYNPESKIDNTKPVYKLSDAEQKEFSKLFNNTINEICLFADKHNFYRNNMLVYLISELLTHYLAYGNSSYDVFCSKQENDKPLGKWIKNQIGEDGYSHTICSECKTEAPFHYSYEEYYDEGMDGEWEFCGLKESGISEVLSNYCPNCGAKMEDDNNE